MPCDCCARNAIELQDVVGAALSQNMPPLGREDDSLGFFRILPFKIAHPRVVFHPRDRVLELEAFFDPTPKLRFGFVVTE